MDTDDRQAIVDLISQYSYSYDENDMERFASLFDKDAIVSIAANEISVGNFIKAVAMRRTMHAKEGIQTKHYQTNTVITEAKEDTVWAKTMFLVVYQHPDKPGPDIVKSGMYHDEFRKIGDSWKFLKRGINLDHSPTKAK